MSLHDLLARIQAIRDEEEEACREARCKADSAIESAITQFANKKAEDDKQTMLIDVLKKAGVYESLAVRAEQEQKEKTRARTPGSKRKRKRHKGSTEARPAQEPFVTNKPDASAKEKTVTKNVKKVFSGIQSLLDEEVLRMNSPVHLNKVVKLLKGATDVPKTTALGIITNACNDCYCFEEIDSSFFMRFVRDEGPKKIVLLEDQGSDEE